MQDDELMGWAATLSDTSTAGRLHSIDCFLREWHGPRPTQAMPDAGVGDWAAPLAWWHSNHAAHADVIEFHNLTEPNSDWSCGPDTDGPSLGPRRLFMSENQGVYLWAYSLEGDDPDVWIALNERNAEWEKEGEPLSGFLLQLLLFEAMGPYSTSADWIDLDTYARLCDALGHLQLAPWRWPAWKTEFLGDSDMFAVAYPTVPDDELEAPVRTVQIKARRPDAFEQLRHLVPADHWDNP